MRTNNFIIHSLFYSLIFVFYYIGFFFYLIIKSIEDIFIEIYNVTDFLSDNYINIRYPYQTYTSVDINKMLTWCKENSMEEPKFFHRNNKTLMVTNNQALITQIVLIFGTIPN